MIKTEMCELLGIKHPIIRRECGLQHQHTEYCDSECRRSGAPFDQWTRNDDHANAERDLAAFR